MKTILLALFAASITVSVAGQSSPPEATDNNLYSIALKASILEMEKDSGHLRQADYRHMIVKQDPGITKGLPTDFSSHSLEYLNSQGLQDRYRKLKEPYLALVIRPMLNEGKTLKIEVAVYWVSYNKKGNLQLGLSDWSDVQFQYDCDKQNFVMSSVKLGGI